MTKLPAPLLLLGAAMVVAVAAASAVGFFAARIELAMTAQAGEAIGADRRLRDRAPIPETIDAAAANIGLQTARTVRFPSVILLGDKSALAAVKAVDPAYPLRGNLRIAQQAFGADKAVDHGPPQGAAWIDARLAGELGAQAGDTLTVGNIALRVDAVLSYEPDRGGGFTTLAPRLMMHRADLQATGLLGPGSRVTYSLLVAGTADQLAGLDAATESLLASGQRWIGAEQAQPELESAISRARKFMGLAALAAVLLAAVAMGMTAAQYAASQQDAVALKKTLGATGKRILRGELQQLALIAAISAVIGAFLGYLAQFGLVAALGDVVLMDLPAAPLRPALPAMGVAVVALLGFAAPPLAQLRHVPPMRVFQRQLGAPKPGFWLVTAAAGGSMAALMVWQTRDVQIAGVVLLGVVIGLAVMAGLGLALTALLRPLRRSIGGGWRYGLANLSRKRGQTVLQLVAVGLGLTVLLLLAVVRSDLLSTWQERLPEDAANAFLINIQPDQVQAVEQFFADRGLGAPELFPMVRGRLTEINGETASADDFDSPDAQRMIEREWNLSWVESLPAYNRMVDGEWWGEAGRGQPLASVEQVLVQRFGFGIGDTIGFDIAGEPLTLTIDNVREVEWDSFAVNFFLVAPPGVLDDYPATWLTSVHVAQADKPALIELVRDYPNITVLDVDALIEQVQRVIARVTLAVEAVFGFTLLAGLLVLLSALLGTRAARRREAALLRTLGASRGRLRQALIAEFGALGLLAGLLAALAAQGIAAVLAQVAFDIPYAAGPQLWLVGMAGGALLAAAAGAIGARGVASQPPLATLR